MKCMNCGNIIVDPNAKTIPVQVQTGSIFYEDAVAGITFVQSKDGVSMGRGVGSRWVEGFPCGVPDCGGYMIPEEEIPLNMQENPNV